MTLDEAKAILATEGVTDPTPGLLKLAGWNPVDVFAGVNIAPPVNTPQSVQDDAAKLIAEAQALNLPTQIFSGFLTVVKGAMGLGLKP